MKGIPIIPNKQALLFALLEDHLNAVVAGVTEACQRARHKPLEEMIETVVTAYVDAKMARPDISTALYRIAAGLDGPTLVRRTGLQVRKALELMLRTAPDASFERDTFAIQMMVGAMAGATRSVLEDGAAPAAVRKLRQHLVLLCRSYMATVAATHALH